MSTPVLMAVLRKIMSPKQSKSQKVTGYKTRSEADRACRKEKISKNKQLSQSMIAAGTARPGDVKGNVVKSKSWKKPRDEMSLLWH